MSKHGISSDTLKQLKSQYAKNKNKILKDNFQLNDTLPNFETFDRAVFDKVLALDGCVSVRMYYVMDDDLQVNLIVVGVDKNGLDIQTAGSNSKKNVPPEPVFAFTAASRCPPICPTPPPDDDPEQP